MSFRSLSLSNRNGNFLLHTGHLQKRKVIMKKRLKSESPNKVTHHPPAKLPRMFKGMEINKKTSEILLYLMMSLTFGVTKPLTFSFIFIVVLRDAFVFVCSMTQTKLLT